MMIDCAFPYKTVSITHRGGYQICPFADPVSSTLDQTPQQFFDSEYANNIRNDMTAGKLSDDIRYACASCLNLESENLPSHRIIPETKEVKLKTIALANFGNKCNLKCVGCGPERSSGFGPEFDTWKEHNFSFDCLKGIDLITMSGGEALYTKYPKMILDRTEAEVHITTNGTILPQWIFNYKDRIKFNISLDGVGALDEYIRTDTDWNKKRSIMDRLCEFDHEFIVTMQLANYKYMQDIISFLKTQLNYDLQYVNQLVEPKYLNPANIPNNQIGNADNYYFLQGLGFFKLKDAKEGTSFLDFYPEYKDFYNVARFDMKFNMTQYTENIPPIVTYDIRNHRIF